VIGAMLGHVLNETYKVKRLIGTGNMGAVYEVAHRRLDRRFALKILHASLAESSEAKKRFRREAQIACKVAHPHVVEVLDYNITADGLPYLVMELLEGESLQRRIDREERLSLAQTASILQQISSAVSFAHSHGIVHRDLKPANILLCERGGRDDYVKVLDFGISKVLGTLSHLTQVNTTMGTPHYMAPEQSGSTDLPVDRRADIYAIGATTYEMLTGKPPFSGSTLPEVIYKVMCQVPTPLQDHRPDLSAEVGSVVQKALQKRPEERYQSMAELWQAFGQAVGNIDEMAIEGSNPVVEVEPADAPATGPLLPLERDNDESVAHEPTRELGNPATPRSAAPVGEPSSPSRPLALVVIAALALASVGAALAVGLTRRGRDPSASPPQPGTRALSPAEDASRARAAPDAAPATDLRIELPPVHTEERVRMRVRHLSAYSVPPGAQVFVDGKRVGETPLEDAPLPARAAVVVLTKSGFRRWSRKIPPRPGRTTLNVTLVALPEKRADRGARRKRPRAMLQVMTVSGGSAMWANVYLDGKKIGQSPLSLSVQAGTHLLEVKRKGFRSSKKKVRLLPGRRKTVSLELSR
jgi:serine/threonine-protein kinase